MKEITATEPQLLACFGVQPVLREADIVWYLNDAVYCIELEQISVSFALDPYHPDVRIIVKRGAQRLFEFNSMGVTDVRVIDEPGIDAVEIIISAEAQMRMQLRPTFEITQDYKENMS